MDSEGNEEYILLQVVRGPKGQKFAISGLEWEDPAAWGILCSDIIGAVASAYANSGIMPKDEAVNRILAGLRAEQVL